MKLEATIEEDSNNIWKFRAKNKKTGEYIYSNWKYGITSFWDNIEHDYTNEYEEVEIYFDKDIELNENGNLLVDSYISYSDYKKLFIEMLEKELKYNSI